MLGRSGGGEILFVCGVVVVVGDLGLLDPAVKGSFAWAHRLVSFFFEHFLDLRK